MIHSVEEYSSRRKVWFRNEFGDCVDDEAELEWGVEREVVSDAMVEVVGVRTLFLTVISQST